MVVVDQLDQVGESLDGTRVVEGEAVTGLIDPARRADVVEVDALRVVGGVVAPLPDPCRVETRCARGVSVGIDGEPA